MEVDQLQPTEETVTPDMNKANTSFYYITILKQLIFNFNLIKNTSKTLNLKAIHIFTGK